MQTLMMFTLFSFTIMIPEPHFLLTDFWNEGFGKMIKKKNYYLLIKMIESEEKDLCFQMVNSKL